MMTLRYPSEWITKVEEALGLLAEKPWALFLVLVCVNTLALPYAGITHDARLYSVQVLNHVEDGSYADDLFFRYGSQDEYSLFSRLAAPLVRGLGLSAAFFIIYLLSKSLLFYGMMRLVQALVPNRAAVALSLIYCMAIGIHVGGHHVLNVQENFVTPRTLACALVLIGLDLLLRQRPAESFGVIALAGAVHPLMAFGGVLIWAGFHFWKYLGGKAFIGATLGICLLATVVLAIEPLGKRCFGAMDDSWRQTIMHASAFNFPSQWSNGDWGYLAFQLVALAAAIWRVRVNADKTRFLIVLMIVTFAAALGAILAEQLPYALLLQGQPYRALWLLAFVHLALATWLCIEYSRHSSMILQLAGCALLAYLCCVNALLDEFVLTVLLFPLLALVFRGLDREPRHADWFVQSLQGSLVLGGVGWVVYKLLLLAGGLGELLAVYPEHRDVLEIVLLNLGPIVFVGGACWVLVRLRPGGWDRPAFGAAAACSCLGLQVIFFALPDIDLYREHCTRHRGDLRAVHALIHRDGAADRLPTVYCNLGCLDYVWIDLRAQSYFDWWQAGNFMFRRDMALEGQRRARMVAPFELARFHKMKNQMSAGHKASVGRFFQTDFDRGPIRKDEVARLCQEPGLDYLVLDEQVDGLEAVAVGRLYVYSCSEVRVALRLLIVEANDRVASRGR